MKNKRVDFGEFVITMQYDKNAGTLLVEVLDEGGEVIESIDISPDDEDDLEDESDFINLN